MRAGESACHCPQCGVVCEGQFNGCATVWAAGPREVVLVRPEARVADLGVGANGASTPGVNGVQVQVTNGAGEPVATVEAAPITTDTVRTAWPSREGGAQPWQPEAPAVPAASVAQSAPVSEPVEPVQPASTPAVDPAGRPAPVVASADERRGQVFSWLKDSFDGVNSQLRVLSDNLSRQQQVLAGMTDAQAAASRLSQLADALPERIGAAVQEAVAAGQRSATGNQGDAAAGSIEDLPLGADPDWRAAVEDAVADLRQPTGATAADPLEAEPSASWAADESLLDEVAVSEPFADHVQGGGQATGETTGGVRSQLSSLASTVQSRVNRTGWQERLRSLSTR